MFTQETLHKVFELGLEIRIEQFEAYHTERKKIEAQQVAGMSKEDILNSVGVLNRSIHNTFNTIHLQIGQEKYNNVLKAMNIFASACVAEKEKEIGLRGITCDVVTEEYLSKTKQKSYASGKELKVGDKIIFGYTMRYANLNATPPQAFSKNDIHMALLTFVCVDNILYQLYELK
jgi:hypothetical protein